MKYKIWMQYTADRADKRWAPTQRFVNGRSLKEANSRMRRMFAKAGFQSMRLVALPIGEDPIEAPSRSPE